jgi:hypothetical protein
MATCAHHMVLNDTEADALETAVKQLIEECNAHRHGNTVDPPWDAQKLAALTILDKLHGDVRCNWITDDQATCAAAMAVDSLLKETAPCWPSLFSSPEILRRIVTPDGIR